MASISRGHGVIKNQRTIYAILILIMIWIIWQPVDQYKRGWISNSYFSGDAVLYFAWLHSIVEDGDIHFADDYAELDPGLHPNLKRSLSSGYTGNIFPPGPAILWSPFYLAAKGTIILAGIDDRAHQLGLLLFAANIGTAIYTCLFTLLIFAIARKITGRWSALLTTVTILFATPLSYYLREERIYSHNLGAFAIALFIWLLLRKKICDRRSIDWLFIGATLGLIASIRLQDVLIGILLAGEQIPVIYRTIRQGGNVLKLFRNYLLAAIAAALSIAPLLIGMWTLYGLGQTPVSAGANTLWLEKPHLFELLFSSRHGLFSWHPLLLPALIGLAVMCWRRKSTFGCMPLLSMIIIIYFTASIGDWHGGSAFGQRRMISYLPLFAMGFATLLNLNRLSLRWTIVSLMITGIFWNQALLNTTIQTPGYIYSGPEESNPLNPQRIIRVNQWGTPLISPWMNFAALPHGIPASHLDWILSYELDTRQHNLGGEITAGFPAFNSGFSAPVMAGGKTIRIMQEHGKVFVTIGHRQPPAYRISLTGELQLPAGSQQTPVVIISVNGTPHALLAGTENSTLSSARTQRVQSGANPWKHGLNEISFELSVMDNDLDSAHIKTEALIRQLPSIDASATLYIEKVTIAPKLKTP